MVQTSEGGKKVAKKLLADNPNYYSELGKKSRKAGVRGFDSDTERARMAGAKGGKTSRRGKGKRLVIKQNKTKIRGGNR